MDNRHHAAPTKTSSDRAFGIVFMFFFCIIASWPLLNGNEPHYWSLGLAAIFGFIAGIKPALLAPLNRQWTRLGIFMHRIVNPLILGLIFVTTILPIGLLLRLFGKDPLRLKRQPDAISYWISRAPPGPSPDSLPRQF